MTGRFFSVTVVGTRRRLDLSLPADVPVGELVPELAALLDEHVDGPPPRWGLVRLGGEVLDAERAMAAQRVGPGAMIFLRDLGVALPPVVVDDYASAVAAAVEALPWRLTPAGFQAVLVGAAVAWVVGAGALATRALLAGGTSDAPLPLAGAVALVAMGAGRALGFPRTGIVLALSALPLWAAGGVALYLQAGLTGSAAIGGGVVAAGVGGLAAAAAGDEGAGPPASVVAACAPWAVTLALSAWLGESAVVGAALLAPVGMALLRFLPWLVVRVMRLDAERAAASLAARTATARQLLAALTSGLAAALAATCVVLVAQPSWWARAVAGATALALLLQARRRRFLVEAGALLLVPLATLATVELQLVTGPAPDWQRLTVLPGTAAALAALGLVARRVRLPVGLRRQLEWLEAVATMATGVLTAGLLGLYDLAARIAGRFG